MPRVRLHSSDVKTLGEAWRRFVRQPSPRWIAGGIVLAGAARLAVGDFGWVDLAVAAGLVAVNPFAEWAIHVYLLHLRPFEFRGRKVELITAKEHRSHHEHPHNLNTVLLGPKEVVGLYVAVIPIVSLALCGAGALLGAGWHPAAVLTALVVGGALVFVYEWTHFLIHTAYRPRTALYRAVWRTHRLHHFKNEHFWHGITSTIADRVLRTNPDPKAVERSATARTLDPNAQVGQRAVKSRTT
jgi:hypothetical protein